MRDDGGTEAIGALPRLAAMAAEAASVAGAVIEIEGRRTVHGGFAEPGTVAFEVELPLWVSGARAGQITLLDPTRTAPLSSLEGLRLGDIAHLVVAFHEREQQCLQFAETSSRAVRADLILRLVSEAASCADALTSLLGELCRHHDALVGRIWRLAPEGTMHEVSRFNGDQLDANSYYLQPASQPVRAGNSRTAEAIQRNQPEAFVYSGVRSPGRYVLLANAVAAGLASQVSFPIWVQDERFGIALAFTTERDDLDAIVADIASLANTIRPVLFRKVTEERIRYLAHNDDLTQLCNRTAFNDRLQGAVEAAQADRSAAGRGLSLLYLDLDGFKLVNDTRGHAVGDRLLTEVAERLRENVRAADTVARIGGDEFAIIQSGAADADGVGLARRLLERFAEPFVFDGQRSIVGVSIGIATFPRDGITPGQLLRNADAALYEAKHSGRNTYRTFDPVLGMRQQRRAVVVRGLKEALDAEAFTLAYQPICDARSRRTLGLEGLLRWTHPERGPQSPADFVPVAEESGLILPLGRWALETGCAEAARWPVPLSLSVNFSPLQFRQPGLPAQIAAVLARTGLEPRRLELEVTEGLLLDDSVGVLRTMHQLKAMGLRITLDDFGTAYASLSSLRRFPFDRIKIDRSFIQEMCDDTGTLAIVQAVLSLSERLGVEVVAEGVETERELEMLRQLGCRMVQGFLTGRPMPGAEARALMAREGGSQAAE